MTNSFDAYPAILGFCRAYSPLINFRHPKIKRDVKLEPVKMLRSAMALPYDLLAEGLLRSSYLWLIASSQLARHGIQLSGVWIWSSRDF